MLTYEIAILFFQSIHNLKNSKKSRLQQHDLTTQNRS